MAIKEGLPPLVSGGLRQVEAGLADILGPWPPPLLFTFHPLLFLLSPSLPGVSGHIFP